VLDLYKRVRVALGEPWFYLRLGRQAGLSLIRVLREGLWLDECLGVTVSRANDSLETAPRTRVPESGAVAEGNAPTAALLDPGASALASSASLDRSALLFSRVVG
jgi:hypothetical protein